MIAKASIKTPRDTPGAASPKVRQSHHKLAVDIAHSRAGNIAEPSVEHTRRWSSSRCWRLRPVPDPAQESECTVAQFVASEQSSADDRKCNHDFNDGRDLTQQGVQQSEACRGSNGGQCGSVRPPRRRCHAYLSPLFVIIAVQFIGILQARIVGFFGGQDSGHGYIQRTTK